MVSLSCLVHALPGRRSAALCKPDAAAGPVWTPAGNAARTAGAVLSNRSRVPRRLDEGSAGSQQRSDHMGLDREHEELLAIFDTMSGAWEAGDAAEFANVYTDDATVAGPGIYLRGREHIRQSMAVAFAGPLKGSRRSHQPQSTRLLGADTAIVVTRSDTVLPGEDQVPPEREHLVTWVLARQGGWWRVEANHMSPVSLDQQPEEA
jgi:uncharacterized protein (TIGR02246 family)